VPAAAVIPAPIAYIKVVAVKTPVVELWVRLSGQPFWCVLDKLNLFLGAVDSSMDFQEFTLKKLECLRQASA
jgi:hypothetical protein